MKKARRIFARVMLVVGPLFAALHLVEPAYPQSVNMPGVLQIGTVTTGNIAVWSGQLAIQDGGSALTGITTGPCLTSSTLSNATTISGANIVNTQSGTTYSVLGTDQCKLVSISNALAVTVTIPNAGTSTFTSGWMSCFQNRGVGSVTLSSASLIDGAGTLTFGQNAGVCVYTDGSTYYTQRGGAGLGTGTVTSVGLTTSNPSILNTGDPVTLSGTLSIGFLTQAANIVFAGPTTGAAVVPAFRSLTGADLPSPTTTQLGGVRAITSVASNWINAITAAGQPTLSQPAFTDITGQVTTAQITDLAVSTGKIADLAVTSAKLAVQPNNTVLGNVSGAAASAIPLTPSAVLDVVGNTQGQILYRSATQWSALSAGTSGAFLSSQGTNQNPIWSAVSGFFRAVAVRSFTSSDWYTPSALVKYTIVFVTGSGAGAGSTASGAPPTDGGGGGGAGCTAISFYSAGTIGTSQFVTIGAGGSAGAAGNQSSFGSLVSANGGSAGANGVANIPGLGGAGCSTTAGATIGVDGGDGESGGHQTYDTYCGPGGHGGSSWWGGGGRGGNTATVNGGAGKAYGSGGGSGCGAGTAGAGKAGIVMVLEFSDL